VEKSSLPIKLKNEYGDSEEFRDVVHLVIETIPAIIY